MLPAMDEHETFAFCMCNPPFFDSDIQTEEARRRKNPGSDFGGSDAETSCPGGARAATDSDPTTRSKTADSNPWAA